MTNLKFTDVLLGYSEKYDTLRSNINEKVCMYMVTQHNAVINMLDFDRRSSEMEDDISQGHMMHICVYLP